MSEYRLAKNSKNELVKADESNKSAKVSKNSKIVLKKNYLVRVTDGAVTLCAKTGKELVKLTNKTLGSAVKKIKEVDWEKVILFLLKSLFFTTQETKKVYYREIKTYPEEEHYTARQNPYREQIQGTETKSIKGDTTKGIENKKQKSIKNNGNIKSIEKKQNRNILKPHKKNNLMIDKQNKYKKEK